MEPVPHGRKCDEYEVLSQKLKLANLFSTILGDTVDRYIGLVKGGEPNKDVPARFRNLLNTVLYWHDKYEKLVLEESSGTPIPCIEFTKIYDEVKELDKIIQYEFGRRKNFKKDSGRE